MQSMTVRKIPNGTFNIIGTRGEGPAAVFIIEGNLTREELEKLHRECERALIDE